MRRLTNLSFVVLFWLGCSLEAACAQDFKAQRSSFMISQQQVLTSYPRWNKLVSLKPSGLHWGNKVNIFINQDAQVYRFNAWCYRNDCFEPDEEASADNRYQRYRAATVVVKENHSVKVETKNGPSSLVSLTIMIKRMQGYDADNGNWQYIELEPQKDGSYAVLLEGAARQSEIDTRCGACHRGARDSDFVFSTLN